MTYEEKIKRIEEIIAEMETGKLSLDDSIKNFKEGTELISDCRKILEGYQKAITMVVGEKDGKPEEEDFTP